MFTMDMPGLAAGLSISPTGRWAVSCPASSSILVFDRDDLLIREVPADSPGDVEFSGLEIWAVDTASGSVISDGGLIVARDCATRNTRLSAERNGRVIVSGSKGVFVIEQGRGISRLAEAGSACFTPEGMLILQNGILFHYAGDTLATSVDGNRLSSSPSGEIVVIWGGTVPSVLE